MGALVVSPSRPAASLEVEEVFEQSASAAFASAFLFVAFAFGAWLAFASAFDFVEEVFVGVGGAGCSFFGEDLVELAAVEPDAAAFGAGVDEDFAALDFDESCSVVGTAERVAAFRSYLARGHYLIVPISRFAASRLHSEVIGIRGGRG